jgi:hypothetical protein
MWLKVVVNRQSVSYIGKYNPPPPKYQQMSFRGKIWKGEEKRGENIRQKEKKEKEKGKGNGERKRRKRENKK